MKPLQSRYCSRRIVEIAGRIGVLGEFMEWRVWIVAAVLGMVGCGENASKGTEGTDLLSDSTPIDEVLDLTLLDQTPQPSVPFEWCDPEVPPDHECYVLKRNPGSESMKLALALAKAQIARHPAEEMKWNWEEAVLMVSLAELYEVTGDAELLAYYKAWMDFHIQKGFVMGSSDTCAPAAVAVALYRQTGDPDGVYGTVVQQALHYLYEEALRTPEGGISHLGTLDVRTLWVDSLFMFGGVLFGWGEATGDTKALEEYAFQFDLFSQLLQDETGFYVHAYNWIVKQTPGVYWGRGNGWIAAAGSMYHRILANRGERWDSVDAALVTLLKAAMKAQDTESGLWWTLMTHPGEIYLETSAAALFAFGLARSWRYGVIGDEALPAIALAMKGVRSRIVTGQDTLPVVTGISGPTTADKYEEYARVPLEDDLGYGVGAVILALIETSGLPEANTAGEEQP